MDILNNLTRYFFKLIIAFILLPLVVHADDPAECFQFEIKNSPERDIIREKRFEIWCYQKIDRDGQSLFIYNADSEVVKPELSFLIDKNGLMTHASLLAGQITVHQVRTKDFNPFSIPLLKPKNRTALKNFKSHSESSLKVQNFLLSSSHTMAPDFTFHSLNLTTQSTTTYFPWRGYWWPRKNMSMLTPLTKYDQFVTSRSGTNPGTASWERANHPYNGVSWSGHCNGWAASSILRPEPAIERADPKSGVVFSVSDQKGILAEADYCVSAAFFGNRNRGGGNSGDIKPELFHKTLLYYVGTLHKPLAMDIHSSPAVDNHVISAYALHVDQIDEHHFTVTATLTVHGYDMTIINTPGIAPSYTQIYKYNLTTDENNQPIAGNWLSQNPDFMWAPLSPGNCQNIKDPWLTDLLTL